MIPLSKNGLGIDINLDATQDISILQQSLCLRFDVHRDNCEHTLYEVIVNDFVEYFVYEIWKVEEPKVRKQLVKELTIPLSEFRATFLLNVNVTHEKIAEKYLRLEK